MAKTMNDNVSGAFRELKSAVDELVLSMGDSALGGSIEELTRGFTENIRFATDVAKGLKGIADASSGVQAITGIVTKTIIGAWSGTAAIILRAVEYMVSGLDRVLTKMRQAVNLVPFVDIPTQTGLNDGHGALDVQNLRNARRNAELDFEGLFRSPGNNQEARKVFEESRKLWHEQARQLEEYRTKQNKEQEESKSRAAGEKRRRDQISKAAKEEADKINDVVEALKFRNVQIQRSAKDQDLFNQLQRAGVDLYSMEGQNIRHLVEEYHKLSDEQLRLSENAEMVGNSIRGIGTAFQDLRSFALNTIADIAESLLQLGAGGSATGGIGGFVAKGLFDAFSSGSALGSFQSASLRGLTNSALFGPGFAQGGIATKPSIFGEAGPEAAVPLPDGRRIPVDLGGSMKGGGDTYYIDATGADPAAIARLERTIREINNSIEPRIIRTTQDRFSRNNDFLRR